MSRNNASSSAISNLPETEVFQNTGGDDPTHCGPEEREYSRERSLSDEDDVVDQPSQHDPASLAILTACNAVVEEFQGQKCSKSAAIRSLQAILFKAIPEDENSLDEAFSCYLEIIDNHEKSLSRAEKRGHQDQSEEFAGHGAAFFEDKGPIREHEHQAAKRARTDESEFPWSVSDFIHSAVLSPSLDCSLKLLKIYAVDPKKAKRSLTNSSTCLEFPDSEWTNVLAGCAVNLDHVLSGYLLRMFYFYIFSYTLTIHGHAYIAWPLLFSFALVYAASTQPCVSLLYSTLLQCSLIHSHWLLVYKWWILVQVL